MNFKLPYYIRHGGDGSVILEPCSTIAGAEAADEAMDEGWGESSAGTIELKVEDGKLYYQDYADINGTYTKVWVEVKESAS